MYQKILKKVKDYFKGCTEVAVTTIDDCYLENKVMILSTRDVTTFSLMRDTKDILQKEIENCDHDWIHSSILSTPTKIVYTNICKKCGKKDYEVFE